MPLPTRTPEERAEALKLAGEARKERAALKQAVRSGDIAVSDVLIKGARGQTDELGVHARVAGRIKVIDLVKAVRGVGPQRAAKILADVGVKDTRRVDQLGVNQAVAIAERLG